MGLALRCRAIHSPGELKPAKDETRNLIANPSKVIFQIPLALFIVLKVQIAEGGKDIAQRFEILLANWSVYLVSPRKGFCDDTNPSNSNSHSPSRIIFSFPSKIYFKTWEVREEEIWNAYDEVSQYTDVDGYQDFAQFFYWHIPLGFISFPFLRFSCLWIFRILYCV